jgi:hypothetical protein
MNKLNYDLKELERNLSKKYYMEFKKFHEKKGLEIGKEFSLIELMSIYEKTNIEPIASASFKRNLIRAIKEIRNCKDPEALVDEKICQFKVIKISFGNKIGEFFKINLVSVASILISISSLFFTYCRISGINDPISYLVKILF